MDKIKNDQIKTIEFDVTEIHGYLKSAIFKVDLSKDDIEHFNNLDTKEEKVFFLETIGEITITDFDISKFNLNIDENLKL